MRSALSERFNLTVSLFAALFCFLVGVLWSASTWRHGFDMGWLVVAFCVARGISARIERGNLGVKDYGVAFWPAAPGFVLEGLSDFGLRTFSLHGRSGDLTQFAVFSCLLLVFITAVIAVMRFGVGIQDLSAEDYSASRGAICALALAVAISIACGTSIILLAGAEDPGARLSLLQSWLYKTSLIVYFLLTIKMVLPLIVGRFRAAFGRRDKMVE
jgi:hypothetical protein